MTTFTQTVPPTAFILSEANGQRSRENFLVSLGKKLSAGEVAKVEGAVSLATTAHLHTNTVMDVLAATTGLVVGDEYAVSGTGIPAGTTFTYGGASAGTLSQASTATSTGVTFTFTKPLGVGPWLVLSDTPAGVSLYAADGTNAAIEASFIARDAEVNLKLLVFPDASDADVIADLAGIGIICRD
jgi:hypothetical protein